MNSLAAEIERYRLALAGLALPPFAGRDSDQPFVVALEGSNGTGKTTLCRSLAGGLGVPGLPGADAAWLVDSFKVRMIRDADWYTSAMFFLSGCFEQMRLARDRSDRVVFLDRSLWSTLAVHAAEGTERLAALIAMLRPVASEIHVPDLTIVLEADLATCQSRIARKTGTSRLVDELTATSAFHAKERDFYHWLGRQLPKVEFLDVDRATAEEVAQQAVALVRRMVPC